MNLSIILTVILIFSALLLILFCAFFSARLAQIKGRSRIWGALGLLLNVLGLIIVCFLPSKRSDNMNTNPITHFISKLPSLSRKTIAITAAIAAAVVLTVIAYDNIPKLWENWKYAQSTTEQNKSEYEQSYMITENVQKIFTGSETTYAISDTGNLYCWGKQLPPQLEGEDLGIIYKNVKKASSNEHVCYILDNNGDLYAIGDNSTGLIPSAEKTVTEFTQVASNVKDFSLSETTLGIIKTDNKLYMYGNNSFGQLGTYSTSPVEKPTAILGNVTAVYCESGFTVALQKSGDAVAFGYNKYGQFRKSEAIFTSPTVIKTNVKQIAAGDDYVLLLDKNGEVFACGNNTYGQLGNGTNSKSTEFVSILKNIVSISAAKHSSYAVSESGELYAWGQNTVGQLGNGNTDDQNVPTVTYSDTAEVSASGLHTVITTSQGDILSTGYNSCNQLGKGGSRDSFSKLVTIKVR